MLSVAPPLHPPKPRLTLRIGITGHRPNKLDPMSAARVKRQLPEIFAAIDSAAADILRADSEVYAPAEPVIRLICGFAEGADQIAVAACPPSWRIEAILPFPTHEYAKDFMVSAGDGRDVREELFASLAKAAVVTQLPLRNPENRNQGYADAGGYMLRQIDLLVAIWDGLPPQQGGTGAIAREAFVGGIPVVWLEVGKEAAPRLITGFDPQGAPAASEADCTRGDLAAALSGLASAPSPASSPDKPSAREGLDRFLRETWRPWSIFSAYNVLRRIANRQIPQLLLTQPSFEKRQAEWDPFFDKTPPAQDLQERLRTVLLPRFAWADMLAVHLSHLYRSAYVLAYGLSALAVFIALISVFPHEGWPESRILSHKAVFVFIELILIGIIIALVWFGRRGAWHERWLDYRSLAESLRHGRFLAYVSEFGRIRERGRGDDERDLPWTLWYVRATMREVGLPVATLDREYQSAILNAALASELDGPDGQLAYHHSNHKVSHNIDHFLHVFGIACFIGTSAILFAFLLTYGVQRLSGSEALEHALAAFKPWVTFFTAGLPALGAALAGIKVHGDFEALTERSAQMVDDLERLEAEYARALAGDLDLDDTSEILIATARIMSQDLAAWQELYGRKRLALPA